MLLCTLIDEQDSSPLKSTVLPLMATIVDEAEDNLIKSFVSPPMVMILEEPENIDKDDESKEMELEVEVVTSLDIKMKEPKDVKFQKLVCPNVGMIQP